jgi:hypothetical protein
MWCVSEPRVPGVYEDFLPMVVPELQRRGLFRKDYTDGTLRENLGLPIPQSGDWRKPAFPWSYKVKVA